MSILLQDSFLPSNKVSEVDFWTAACDVHQLKKELQPLSYLRVHVLLGEVAAFEESVHTLNENNALGEGGRGEMREGGREGGREREEERGGREGGEGR